MAYIGRQNLGGAYRQLDDISSGFDGSDTTHTMQVNSQNVTVGDVNQIILSLGGVIQKPGTDFTVSGSVLTFTTAPAANTSFFAILLGSDNGGTVTPTDGSVTTDKIAADQITKAKLADAIDIFQNTSLLAADLGDGVHIKSGDSGGAVTSTADELVVEGAGDMGIQLLGSASGDCAVAFGDSGDSNVGLLTYNHTSNYMRMKTNDSESFRIHSGGEISTNAEAAPDVDDGGLCLNHGANDGTVIELKNSDVAHSITTRAEADTYCFIQKSGSGDGGLQINGINDNGNVALQLRGLSNGGEDTGKGTGDHGCVRIDATSRTGTTTGGQGSNVNMVTICNNNTVRFIFDAEGDLHSDSSNTTFDAYEDAQLVRAYDLSHGKGVIASKFDDFIKYNQDDLTDAGLVGKVNHEYNTDGTKANPLINMSGFMRLHNGAIWQQYEKHQRLAEAVYEMAKEALGEDKADAILEKHDIKLLN